MAELSMVPREPHHIVRSLLMRERSRGLVVSCRIGLEDSESLYRSFVLVGICSLSLGRVMRTMRRYLGEPGLECSGSSSTSGVVATMMHEGALDAARRGARGLECSCSSALCVGGSEALCCFSVSRRWYVSAPTVRTCSL